MEEEAKWTRFTTDASVKGIKFIVSKSYEFPIVNLILKIPTYIRDPKGKETDVNNNTFNIIRLENINIFITKTCYYIIEIVHIFLRTTRRALCLEITHLPMVDFLTKQVLFFICFTKFMMQGLHLLL